MKDRFGLCVVCGRKKPPCCEKCHRAHDLGWMPPYVVPDIAMDVAYLDTPNDPPLLHLRGS